MIGQQKRSLEHSVSPPTKYQKHYDDNLCEASAKVASPTGVQFDDIGGLFSEVQPKDSPSPGATGFDSSRSFGNPVELGPSDERRRLKVSSHVDQEEKGETAQELDAPADLSPGLEARYSASLTCPENCMGPKVDSCTDSENLRAELGNHSEERIHSLDQFCADNSEHPEPNSGEDLCCFRREECAKNPLNLSFSRSGSVERGGSCQKDDAPNSTDASELAVEDEHAFLESVKNTVESRRPNGSRPLPVFLSGKVINLYLMNEQVKAHAGYENVTSKGLWGKVSQALGFLPECGPGVKLIYFKYLKHFERETSQSLEAQLDATSLDVAQARIGDYARESRLDDGKHENPSSLVGEQFAESEPFFQQSDRGTVRVDASKAGVCHHVSRLFEDEAEMHTVSEEKETGAMQSYDPGRQRSQSGLAALGDGWEDTQTQSSDRESPTVYADPSLSIIPRRGFETENSRNNEELKRGYSHLLGKSQQPLINTLIWIKRMALDPGNPHMGEGVEGAGENEEWVKGCASQAEKIRECFWKKKEESKMGEGHQARQLPSPSHYYDESPRRDQQSTERFRATRERVAQYVYPGSPGLNRSFHEGSPYLQRGPSPQNHWSNHRLPRSFHSSYGETGYPDFYLSDRPRKRVPVGPDYQADVPLAESPDERAACERARLAKHETQSIEEDNEESSRWFGTQVWPPSGWETSFPDFPVGVGRALTCACLYPGSMDCVRVHIQEERVRLVRELGQAFYIWKFDEMGESVADTWTREEERTFKAVVKMNPPSSDKNFWEQLPDAFPGRKMRDLVSYYFNVYVLKRRAVQNRLDGRHVDSDDDETELPEADSDDSDEEEEEDEDEDEYDSGEEPDEYAEEDTSDAEYETDHQNEFYGGARSDMLEEHAGFCDLGGVKHGYCTTNMEMDADVDVDGLSVDICTPSVMNLNQDFRSPTRETLERDASTDSAQLTPNWCHVQVEKHLETHSSLIGEDELQEVKTWEDPHWDEADHHQEVSQEEALVDTTLSGQINEREVSPSRNGSGYMGAGFGEDHRNALSSCEGGVWDSSPKREGDKLLSTNGMIQELFGDESPGSDSPS